MEKKTLKTSEQNEYNFRPYSYLKSNLKKKNKTEGKQQQTNETSQ